MGRIIQSGGSQAELLQYESIPLIFLQSASVSLCENAKRIGLNLPLANSLLRYPEEQRPFHVLDEIREILYASSEPLLLEKYELLFSPAYKLNVMKVFSDLARIRRLYAVWPGKMQNSSLIYAEPGDPEYRNYRIADYDVIVIA